MQAFMQSLQMRWPVPGHIGLSIITMARAPSESPCLRRMCISEIFSSSGQPLRSMPSALVAIFGVRCSAVVHFAEDLAAVHARIGEAEAVPHPQAAVRADHRFGQRRDRALDRDKVPG